MGIARDYTPYRVEEGERQMAGVSRGAVRVPKPGSTDGSDRVQRHHSHQMHSKETDTMPPNCWVLLGPFVGACSRNHEVGTMETTMPLFHSFFDLYQWSLAAGCWLPISASTIARYTFLISNHLSRLHPSCGLESLHCTSHSHKMSRDPRTAVPG
jgi:hypothetical protein